MDTFTWLTLGHLLGDWVLQNDWMALGKRKKWLTLAGLTHFGVYTVTVWGALWFAGYRDLLAVSAALAIVFFSHWLIDASDVVERWMRLYRKSNAPFVQMMVDQTFHLLVLAGVALLVARY